MTARHRVLVVDPDDGLRRMVRLGLEVDGAVVVEAATLSAASWALDQAAPFTGLVLDPRLPDGDGLSLLDRTHAMDVVIHLDEEDAYVEVVGSRRVTKGDLSSIEEALHLPSRDALGHRALAACEILQDEAGEIAADWRELCRWDPMLPPDSQPPIAEAVINAVLAAMSRPQPLGWGADPEIEKVAEVLARSVGAVDVVIGQLVCLREVIRRRLTGRVPADETAETENRLHMILDRAIACAASRAADQLQEEAYLDPLTRLLNRRALERDLRREVARAARYGRRFTLVMLDLDGLKLVNDRYGHTAGDERLLALAEAMDSNLRSEDSAYRVGGDEFVLLLPETDDAPVDLLVERLKVQAPSFGWGSATCPDDGVDLESLIEAADRKLVVTKASSRAARLSADPTDGA